MSFVIHQFKPLYLSTPSELFDYWPVKPVPTIDEQLQAIRQMNVPWPLNILHGAVRDLSLCRYSELSATLRRYM